MAPAKRGPSHGDRSFTGSFTAMYERIRILELGEDYVKAEVESKSQPGKSHVVEVTRYGAVCDCRGALNLKHRDICVHAQAVLDYISRNYGVKIAMEKHDVGSHYVRTGSFIDAFGGLLAGEPTLFYGPDGSGKTISVLTIIARYSNICDGLIVYVNTETGDPQNRYARNVVKRFGGNLDKIEFLAFVEESKLHAFLGGRSEEEKERERFTLKDVLKRDEISLVAIDSVSRFYNSQVNNAPPPQRPGIAAKFAGKLGIWVRFMQDLMFRSRPFPVILTAWMRSGIGDILRDAEKKKEKKVEEDVEEMLSPQQLKEWTGPKALGYWSKTIYKIMPAGVGRIQFTQIRGEQMMKQAYCRITDRGVELEQ